MISGAFLQDPVAGIFVLGLFSTLTFVLSIIISVLFHAVIMHKLTIEQRAILQIQRDTEKCVEKIKETKRIFTLNPVG